MAGEYSAGIIAGVGCALFLLLLSVILFLTRRWEIQKIYLYLFCLHTGDLLSLNTGDLLGLYASDLLSLHTSDLLGFYTSDLLGLYTSDFSIF